MTQKRYNICVRGALALVLYVMRALCAAPLVFESRGIRVSNLLSQVGRVFITLTGLFVVIDGYIEFVYLNADKTILSRFFWVLTIGGTLVTNIIAVYTASSRMHLYLRSLKILNEIKLRDAQIEKAEKKIDLIIICYAIISFIACTFIYAFYLIAGLKLYDDVIAVKYVFQKIIHYTENLLPVYLTIEFALITLQVYFTMQTVNAQFSREIEKHRSHTGVLKVSTIRQCAFPYMSVSRVVSQVVEHDENILIVILIIFFCSLGWIVQILFSEIYKQSFQGIVIGLIHLTTGSCIQVMCLVLLIEPCHRVHEEMENTHRLVCKAMVCTNLSVQVTNELEAFKRLLNLNKPTYSLLRVCTLSRPLFLKIVGTIISYSAFIVNLSEDFF